MASKSEREARRSLMALRLEVPQEVADQHEALVLEWVRAAEREAAASALEEAADNDPTTGSFRPSQMVKWLRARAAAIREGKP